MARQAGDHKGGQRPRVHQRQVAEMGREMGHEWLDQYIIETIEEAQDHATQWLWIHNNDRPNLGIGGITPAQKLKMAA